MATARVPSPFRSSPCRAAGMPPSLLPANAMACGSKNSGCLAGARLAALRCGGRPHYGQSDPDFTLRLLVCPLGSEHTFPSEPLEHALYVHWENPVSIELDGQMFMKFLRLSVRQME
jgi:hypothetical protein